MIDAVIRRYIAEIEGIDALKAADVVSVLVGVGASLVMGIYAALRTEIMLRCLRVELIQLQDVVALDDRDVRQRNRSDDCALAPADRAIASSRLDDSVRKEKFEFDGAAVAGCAMP